MRTPASAVLILSLALPAALPAAVDPPAEGAPGTTGIIRTIRGGFCPDIAFTGLLREKGLSYLHSPEFADAVSAVAEGASSFSPPEIPAGWPAAASAWRLHILAHEWAGHREGPAPPYDLRPEWEDLPADGERCHPYLLYLASREYRSKPGQGDAQVAFPYFVPPAVEELGDRIRLFAYRVEEISSRIEKAEALDAGRCAPGKLTLAKEALEAARDIAWTTHFDAGATEPLLARSAIAADDLLTERRYAQRHGIACYSR